VRWPVPFAMHVILDPRMSLGLKNLDPPARYQLR
jgi:hypothetical protein